MGINNGGNEDNDNDNDIDGGEMFDDSTMIISENNQDTNGQNGNMEDVGNENDEQFLTMIERKKPKRNEEEEKKLNIDPRSPEYIVAPLFTERSVIYKEFELDDYIQDNPSKEQLMEIRKSLWTAYWKDKQILEDYYIDCRRQIRELLDKMKQQKKKKKHRSSTKSNKSSTTNSSTNK